MPGTHGDLFSEIGKMVLAAHVGQAIDLKTKSEELAHRYIHLGVSAETMARAIARSLGAVGVSLAIVTNTQGDPADQDADAAGTLPPGVRSAAAGGEGTVAAGAKSASVLLPSGIRLAVLS